MFSFYTKALIGLAGVRFRSIRACFLFGKANKDANYLT